MEVGRKNLSRLFILNPAITGKKDIYLWINDDEDLKNITCTFSQCVVNNIYFCGFVTDQKTLIGLSVLNKYVYDIAEVMDDRSLVLSEDVNSRFYCPVKVLNPQINLSNIVVWGAGNNGRAIAEYFNEKNIPIQCFIDSDQNKIGSKINGIEICGTEKVKSLPLEVSLIEASDRYAEIDRMIQETAPEINCYIYSYAEENRCFVLGELIYLKELVEKNIYIYGYNPKARQLSQCLTVLDYNFTGFLVDEHQYDESPKGDEVLMSPEELLYYDNYFVIIVQDEKELAVKKLQALGLHYFTDFSPIETISSYLLYMRKNIIDTNLGHTYKSKIGLNGVEVYGSMSPDNYRIVVLGGSTTDGNLFPFQSWPEIMFDRIHSDKVTVYNAGVSGYTSAQELIKMIRDLILLKPDMVIVYDGYNDTSEINACPGKYYEFIYLKRALDFAREHMSHSWDFISRDDEEEKDSILPVIGNFENWLMNIELMHAISVDRGIKFYSFLQPMLSSKKNLTLQEKGILFEVEKFQRLKNTRLTGKEFREKIGAVVKTHDYIYDLSHIFDDARNVYMDICHVRAGANEIIAEEVLKRIELLS